MGPSHGPPIRYDKAPTTPGPSLQMRSQEVKTPKEEPMRSQLDLNQKPISNHQYHFEVGIFELDDTTAVHVTWDHDVRRV